MCLLKDGRQQSNNNNKKHLANCHQRQAEGQAVHNQYTKDKSEISKTKDLVHQMYNRVEQILHNE